MFPTPQESTALDAQRIASVARSSRKDSAPVMACLAHPIPLLSDLGWLLDFMRGTSAADQWRWWAFSVPSIESASVWVLQLMLEVIVQ